MKNIKFTILAAAVLAFAACSGNTDTEEYTLAINADKTEIYADGSQAVTFTVSYGQEDVSKSGDMVISWEKNGSVTEMKAGENSFSTSSAGTYSFSARYTTGGKTVYSGETVVTAKEVETLSSGYYRRMLAMEFTSILCTSCPFLAEAVETLENEYPGRIIPVGFHCDNLGTDPMTLPLNRKFYEKASNNNDGSLPLFAFDMRKSGYDIINEYAKIESEMLSQLEDYPAICGVAVSSSCDVSGKLAVEARFKSDIPAEYRYHIFLVEDGIEYTQAGYDGAGYIHENVLRAIASDNVNGTLINSGNRLVPGKEYTYSKTFTLDPEWEVENMRIVVCMLKAENDGSYHVNNSNECGCGESAEYIYEE